MRKICIFARVQIFRADRHKNLRDGMAYGCHVSLSTFGGGIFRGLQIGGQNGFYFGQIVCVFDLRHIGLIVHSFVAAPFVIHFACAVVGSGAIT